MTAQQVLKERMSIRMMTGKDLADVSGFAHSTVLAWLNGKSQPTFYAMQICLQAMGYKIEIKVADDE